MIDRRRLIGNAATSLLIAPLASHAQLARKVYRVGILSNAATVDMVGPAPRFPLTASFLRGMRELGYVYGEHFVTEPRGSDGKPERYAGMATELVRLQVDVIVSAGPALTALKQATSTIPIVMGGSTDPVALGYVRSLAHPGGNITGLSRQALEATGKRIELLKDLVPGAALVAVLWDRPTLAYWQAAEAAARQRGWKLLSLELQDGSGIEGAFRAAKSARAGALVVSAAGLNLARAEQVADLAASSSLPAIYEFRRYVEAGGLMSYGADLVDIWRRTAIYVDKILKGAKPGDLPVEQPTKFELVINLKTAGALGLTIPQALRLRADELIE